ncbi:beta-carboxysome assembly chaperone CcmS [Umezakia ovalisporum]|uniref:Chaperone protein CcmS domain-containing protein n=1 Tax=Umezakia ovalisporum FSS-62 TaxID=2971776 RepID=A0AA43GZJ3_9CYAN|nr:hypothetical protein [Umezakia ovalisporum]MDH6064315.1 hypothetical protein [Umezakia ovalisporum FSS-62]MDH6072919.1 hypothetical protein [Umezakia ovalisporum CS-1034]MDH6077240.1 hypothetical protein [Umezakia ovalisporum FSS-45]
MMFGTNQPFSENSKWRIELDKFVKENQRDLAALFWGLWLANGNSQGTVGIDLQPNPHFVYCPQAAIEYLNEKVENRLQEILGIIAHYEPDTEVVMIAIGKGEIKLIQFAPQPPPPICFEQAGKDVDALLDLLEGKLSEVVFLNPESP